MSSTSFPARKPVTVEKTIGGKTFDRDRTTGQAGQRRGRGPDGRHDDPGRHGGRPGPRRARFLPATVDYREKVYAAGKFPGGFIKREGRPTTKEILTSRLIDRPIRPLFPESYRDEVQIQAGPISADRQNDADVLSMIGASATLILAQVPVPRARSARSGSGGSTASSSLADRRGDERERPRPGRRQHRRRPSS